MAAPVVFPKPERTLIVPGGNPAFSTSVQRYKALKGVCSAVLSTTVLPQASAGATFHAEISGYDKMKHTEHGQRKVPWDNLSAHTEWLVHRVLKSIREVRDNYSKTSCPRINNFPVNFISPSAIISNNISCLSNIIILGR